ncbi:DUF4239 domain-containing protein [Edaphobacter aggregans]|uniref:bestrophin-like domain n=1 Tax=Edaphobacter aggregans TaxID=570835 RepID=UPI0012FAB697
MMLSSIQSALVVLFSVAAALLLVVVLNRLWPSDNRKLLNDVTGWQLGVLGTTYGVILGFMLYTVWEGFRAAQIDANLKATSMMNVYRLADGLPSPQRESMQELARKYETTVVEQEWPAMQHQIEDRAASVVLGSMWKVLATVRVDSMAMANSVDHIQYAMSNLAERRNMRDQQRTNQLPALLWVLLILGGLATIVSSCLLGNDKQWLHYCQVGALTFVIITALAGIADLARPYQGAVAVEPSAFVRALQSMKQEPAQ